MLGNQIKWGVIVSELNYFQNVFLISDNEVHSYLLPLFVDSGIFSQSHTFIFYNKGRRFYVTIKQYPAMFCIRESSSACLSYLEDK
jgi:hypothetical protein